MKRSKPQQSPDAGEYRVYQKEMLALREFAYWLDGWGCVEDGRG